MGTSEDEDLDQFKRNQEEIPLVSRNRKASIRTPVWLILVVLIMGAVNFGIVQLSGKIYNKIKNNQKKSLDLVESLDVSIYLSSYIKSVFLTTMGRPFDLYLNAPVMLFINGFFSVGKSFWLSGIEKYFGNFKASEDIEKSFMETFQGSACSAFMALRWAVASTSL